MKLLRAFKKRKKLIFVGLILLITLVMSSITNAESDTIDVWMEDGEIVFEIKSKAASDSNNIRYRTTGFTLSMTSQSKMLYKIEN